MGQGVDPGGGYLRSTALKTTASWAEVCIPIQHPGETYDHPFTIGLIGVATTFTTRRGAQPGRRETFLNRSPCHPELRHRSQDC